MQLAKRSAGIDTERADECFPSALVDLEGLRLPSGAVEREHQLAAELLTEGVLLHQDLQLTDELCMPAAGQVTVDPFLQAAEVKLLQAGDLTLGEVLIGELRERRPTPERERRVQLSLRGPTPELLEIERVGRDTKQVAGWPRLDTRLSDQLPQL